MSAATATTDLNKVEFEQLVEVIEPLSDSFRRWRDAGADVRDIGCIHASNVAASLDRKVEYLKMRDKLMDKYDIGEQELLSQVLHTFADTRRR